jgi:uncharacterized metal-binding protein
VPATLANGGNALHRVETVSIMPCQGIKRTGGRITQRAAYHIVEDRFLGKSNLICISALAAGVQEDVDMLENYPIVAINGCGLRCASVAAEHHGVAAVAHVDLPEVDPDFDCEKHVLEADLTERESVEALRLADATSETLNALMGTEIEWQPAKINLHGLVHEAGKLNAITGYKDYGKGFLVRLAEDQIRKAESDAAAKTVVPPAPPSAPQQSAEGACVIVSQNETPGLRKVAATLFRRRDATVSNVSGGA